MQGMVDRKRSRGNPRQIWDKNITDTFGTMVVGGILAEDRHQFRSDIWAEDMLREEEEKKDCAE